MSKQIVFRKTQVAVALGSLLAAGGALAYTPPPSLPADYLVDSAQVEEFLLVQEVTVPSNQIPVAGSGTAFDGDPFYVQDRPVAGQATSYELTRLDVIDRQTVTTSGAVLAEANGNLTLTGGSTQTLESVYDQALTFVVPNAGDPFPDAVPVNGTYVANAFGPNLHNFIEGKPALTTVSNVYNGGGDLRMDGDAQIKDGILVSTRGTGANAGIENYGGGRLEVSAGTAKIGMITPGQPSSAFRGLTVTPTSTTLSGGTGTTSLVLNDAGATFSTTGQPATKVTGVAAGSSTYDAVNYGQFNSAVTMLSSDLSDLRSDFDSGYRSLKKDIKDVESKAYGGIAAAVALAGIPAPAAGKTYTVGAGWGNFEGENAFALGGRAQVTPEFQLTAGWGYSTEGNAFNVGAGYSW